MFFIKPETSLLRGNKIYYPSFTKKLNYECELVVKICKVGKNIESKFAHKYYNEISLGLDLTARDLQTECKKNGLPWEISKSFDFSAPISNNWISKEIIDISKVEFNLLLNNQVKQTGRTSDMLFSIDEIIAYVSQYVTLKIGDVIFTGTPEGVGELKIGDKLKGLLDNQTIFEYSVH